MHLYPSQEMLRVALRDYMEEKYPDYMANLSAGDFINKFHEEWASPVSIVWKR